MVRTELAKEKIGVVFIYGVGLEGKVWSKVVKSMTTPYLIVDYPLREGTVESREKLTLEDYIIHMRKQVAEWEVERFIIVAHSLGGILALRIAADFAERLVGFVAVGASISENGGSFISTLPFPKRQLISFLLRKMGTRPPEAAIRTGLCNDLSSDIATEVVRGFIPESIQLYKDPIMVSVPNVPKLYVKLLKDKEFSQSHQHKMISNLSPQVIKTLNTGHLPMLSDPEGLCTILEQFLSEIK